MHGSKGVMSAPRWKSTTSNTATCRLYDIRNTAETEGIQDFTFDGVCKPQRSLVSVVTAVCFDIAWGDPQGLSMNLANIFRFCFGKAHISDAGVVPTKVGAGTARRPLDAPM